ncbi:thioredoxin [Clostridium taeniosporum]|uniref:Thioredoxin n=1 Tax=Clostridium taeniosporum TaxID=394958 RepID=A0A1D7XLE8_9CLOT|nr:thioredoxin [Clostridium taeniosporum]AOR24162.1 thioredoxin [Clostridium taeniosporum]
MAKIINSKDFIEQVENTKGVVIVDFFANWCGPCKMLAPIFEEVSNEFNDKAKLFKLDVDESGDIAQKYGVFSIPTMIIFKDGKAVENLTGFMPKENITNKLKTYL